MNRFALFPIRVAIGAWSALGRRAQAPGLRVVNTDSVANRALITVIAIMTFLAALAGGAASMMRSASKEWSASLSNEITVQVKPALGRDISSDLSKAEEIVARFPGVEKVTILSQADSGELLRPWLGSGFDLKDLPIPRLIMVRVRSPQDLNVGTLSEAIKHEVPNALVDDHKTWRNLLEKMSDALIGVSFFILSLFVLAMGLAVSFATRGAMASSREVVEVLHFVGASDAFIAQAFQRHFLKVGLIGASLGAAIAGAFIWIAGRTSERLLSTRSGEQIEALFGRIEVDAMMMTIMLLVALAMASVTGIVSRVVVIRLLKDARLA